ncbi:MAG: hypothetical protein ACXVO9_14850, partial [Bacteroidia bacterium]
MKAPLIYLLSLVLLASHAQNNAVIKNYTKKFTGVCFTENLGQVGDQNNKPRPDVLFGGEMGSLV